MDEDATWYESRPPRRPHCIRRVPSAPRRGTAPTKTCCISTWASALETAVNVPGCANDTKCHRRYWSSTSARFCLPNLKPETASLVSARMNMNLQVDTGITLILHGISRPSCFSSPIAVSRSLNCRVLASSRLPGERRGFKSRVHHFVFFVFCYIWLSS